MRLIVELILTIFPVAMMHEQLLDVMELANTALSKDGNGGKTKWMAPELQGDEKLIEKQHAFGQGCW